MTVSPQDPGWPTLADLYNLTMEIKNNVGTLGARFDDHGKLHEKFEERLDKVEDKVEVVEKNQNETWKLLLKVAAILFGLGYAVAKVYGV